MALTQVDLRDSEKLIFGTGDDLEIYHNGTNSKITNSTGTLYLEGTTEIWNSAGSETIAKFTTDGACELYHNNVKKLNTDSGGIEVVGAVMPSGNISMVDSAELKIGTGDDLKIYHDGSNSYIDETATGSLILRASPSIEFRKAGGTEKMLYAEPDAQVELYYDNSKKLETTNIGCDIPLTSSGDGLRLYSTGNVWGKVSADVNRNNTSGGMMSLQGLWNGSQVNIIELQTGDDTTNKDDGRLAFYTRESGSAIRNNFKIEPDGTIEIPNDNQKLTFGAGNDIQIFHDGTVNRFLLDGETYFNNKANSECFIITKTNGAVEVYYDGSKKIETISTGVNITGGIRLGGNNAANEMDDYEAGDWTPTFEGSSTAGSFSFGSGYGTGAYVKVGNLVTCTIYTGNMTISGTGGVARVANFPFTSRGGNRLHNAFVVTHPTCFDHACTGGYINPGATYGYFMQTGSTTSSNTWNNSGGYLMFTVSYQTA